jgi:N-ethylmaleimide reductase
MNGVLFQPFHLHDLTLRNRIVPAPMTRGKAGAGRLPNRLMADWYSPTGAKGYTDFPAYQAQGNR